MLAQNRANPGIWAIQEDDGPGVGLEFMGELAVPPNADRERSTFAGPAVAKPSQTWRSQAFADPEKSILAGPAVANPSQTHWHHPSQAVWKPFV